MTISSREQMDAVMDQLKQEKYQVLEVKKGERVKKAPLPFITSTLQQEASKVLNFPRRRPCALRSSFTKELT